MTHEQTFPMAETSGNSVPSTRRQLFNAIFNSEDSVQLYRSLVKIEAFRGRKFSLEENPDLFFRSGGYSVDEMRLFKELPDLLKDPQTGRLHRGIIDRITRSREWITAMSFPLALLFSQIPTDTIAHDTGISLESSVHTDASFHILPVHKAYTNCLMSEGYLEESMRKGETTSAYGGLLVKNYGQQVALCYRAVTDGNRTFVPGFWYGSVSEGLRYELRGAIENGVQEIAPQGIWVLCRPSPNGDILPKVKGYLNSGKHVLKV